MGQGRLNTLAVAGIVGILAGVIGSGLSPKAALAGDRRVEANSSGSWLDAVNSYRTMAALNPVADDPSLSGTTQHSCYMLANGMSHEEVPGRAGYTPEGELAGRSSNIAVSTLLGEPSREFVDLWMSGPFHAVGLLRPELQRVGFGRCDRVDTPKWRSGATLDVVRGLARLQPRLSPIVFPGNGATTSLYRFVAEKPNPLDFCGWTGSAGLPVLALLPSHVAADVTTSLLGPNGPVQTCTLSEHNTDATARSILSGDNVVVAVPRVELAPGAYRVVVTNAGQDTTWGFQVVPVVVAPPAPNAEPLGAATRFAPIAPERVVDTRESFGAERLSPLARQRIQIAGRGAIPSTSRLASLNITVTQPAAAGYLTLWNCAEPRPVVANLNFAANTTRSNAAYVGLDADGGLCAVANVATDLVIDVNGVALEWSNGRLVPVAPRRLLDTRSAQQLIAGGERAVGIDTVTAPGVVATAAVLGVTAVRAESDAFVTAWACGTPRPLAASLNPLRDRVASNLVVVPVGANASVCFYASAAMDLVVDIVGYVTTGQGLQFTATRPFRLVDTRAIDDPLMSAFTGGPLAAATPLVVAVAATRGIPASARAVLVNIAVTDATADGYLVAYPCGERPFTSNVNYEPGAPTSTAAVVPLSPAGELCVYSQQRVNVIIDVAGWWA